MLSQLLPQEHRDVAVFVAIVQHHAGQILVRAAQVEPVRARPQQSQFTRAKVSQVRFDDGLDAVIHAQDDQVAPRVRVVQRALHPGELREQRLRYAAGQGHDHGLVILVAVPVDHHDHPVEPREMRRTAAPSRRVGVISATSGGSSGSGTLPVRSIAYRLRRPDRSLMK